MLLARRADRIRTLAETILAGVAGERLATLTGRAMAALAADGACVSMVTDRQVSLAVTGSAQATTAVGSELPLNHTICANVVRDDSTVVIPDARLDPRVAHVPAVEQGVVGTYLGAPIRWHGTPVAVLCVFGQRPRSWSDADRVELEAHAATVAAELKRLNRSHA